MANTANVITNMPACTSPQSTDVILGANSTNTVQMSVGNLMGNGSINVISCNTLVLIEATTPVSNTAPPANANTAKSFWCDGNYIYYYNGTTIKRAALSDF